MKNPVLIILPALVFLNSCNRLPDAAETRVCPGTDAGFTRTTIPCNIAPLNFTVQEIGSAFLLRIEVPEGKT